MKVQIEDLGATRKKLDIEIPQDEVKSRVESTYKRLSREVTIKGFRRGHVPRDLLKRQYGSHVNSEVAGEIIAQTTMKALQEHKFEPVIDPVIEQGDFDEEKDFSFSVTIEIKPEIELTDYKDIPVTLVNPFVSEDDLSARLEELRERFARLETLSEERPAQVGDYVAIDYTATIAGEPVKDGQGENVLVEISADAPEKSIPRTAEGMKIGEEQTVEITYPPEIQREELAGQTVRYDVKLREIKTKILPPLDDEFAKEVGPFENLQTLREKVLEEMMKSEETRLSREVHDQLIKAIIERNPFEVPKGLVDTRLDTIMERVAERPGEADSRLKMRGELEEMVTIQTKREMILDRIIEMEGIRIGDEETETKLSEIASEMNKSVESVRGMIHKEGGIDKFKSDLAREKSLAFLMENAKIVDAQAE